MALTITDEVQAAALDGITALLADLRLDTSLDAELAVLPLSWAAASTATPSTAVATVTADSSVTDGTIAKFILRSSGAAARISGSVGVGSGDLQVSDNVIPPGTSQVTSSGITLSLTIS